MKRLVAALLLGLAACVSDAPVETMGRAPPAPAYLKDLPDETRNGLAVNYTEAKVGAAVAPELLVSSSGQSIRTAREWEMVRRPEIIKLLTENQYGSNPAIYHALKVRYAYSERAAPALNGLALRTQSTVHVEAESGEHAIDVVLYTPAKAPGPSPVVLMVNFNPNILVSGDDAVKETDAWTQDGKRIPGRDARLLGKPDLKAYLDRGYGVALVYYGQIEPDFKGGSAFGLRRIFGAVDEDSRRPTQGGSIATWSLGLSLVRGLLADNALVDDTRIALYGVSRLGKTALWAGATDEEFAAVIAVCSGEGGGALSRRNYGETIGHVAANFPYWFAPRWNGFAADPAAAPVDSHMVMAAIAPRPLMIIAGETDAWSDPYGEFLAARLATPVWRLFGGQGVDAAPELDQVTGGELSFLLHKGGHGPTPADTPAILDFLDRYMPADSR